MITKHDLTSHYPCARTPAACKEKDIYTDEGDQNFVRSRVVDGCADNCHNELRNTHACDLELAFGAFWPDVSLHTDSSEHEQGPSSPFLNEVKSRHCRTNIDDIRDHRNDERILNARVLEVRSAEIEDKVYTYIRVTSASD